MLRFPGITWILLLASASSLPAAGPGEVLLIVNDASAISRTIGEYYAHKRSIPARNICHINASTSETTDRASYRREVADPIAAYLRNNGLVERVLYIVTTLGIPLRVKGTSGPQGENASVDSELTLLYDELHGRLHSWSGPMSNPYFRVDKPFSHPEFSMYLVTRLAGYDFADVRAIIDKSLMAKRTGVFVIDLSLGVEAGEEWLLAAANRLPKERVVLDRTKQVITKQKDVIGYAGWGSNDPNRTQRFLGFAWLPGAIATEYVSTNARTFQRPPEQWTVGSWKDRSKLFFSSPQTLTADYIHEGATGASGHIDEPFLSQTPRPDYLLPAYWKGRNLAESYYTSIPGLSWQNVVVGDPLCVLK